MGANQAFGLDHEHLATGERQCARDGKTHDSGSDDGYIDAFAHRPEISRLDDVPYRGYSPRVLDGLFPDGVSTAWGDPVEPGPPLFPDEEALLGRAVTKRRLEFAKGRECARIALGRLGFADVPLLSGKNREPLWPADTTGSITHTSGLCAVAVASTAHFSGLGIDAEPADPLTPEVTQRILGADDDRTWAHVTELERSVIPRLVFCAKEAFYKCQFPISRTFLGFDDVTIALEDGRFRATLRRDALPFRTGATFVGRWRRAGRFLVAGTWVIPGDRVLP